VDVFVEVFVGVCVCVYLCLNISAALGNFGNPTSSSIENVLLLCTTF